MERWRPPDARRECRAPDPGLPMPDLGFARPEEATPSSAASYQKEKRESGWGTGNSGKINKLPPSLRHAGFRWRAPVAARQEEEEAEARGKGGGGARVIPRALF
jgi:hypothetical protein